MGDKCCGTCRHWNRRPGHSEDYGDCVCPVPMTADEGSGWQNIWRETDARRCSCHETNKHEASAEALLRVLEEGTPR